MSWCAGQAQTNETWFRFDRVGGALAKFNRDHWESLVSRAVKLSAKEVDQTFRGWSLDAAPIVSA
jgi:hypothetical protein